MSRHSERPRDWPRMGWIKLQRCCLSPIDADGLGAGDCEGPTEADHAGDRFTQGDGYRADDDTVIPLCTKHHRDRTTSAGYFASLTREQRVTWRQSMIGFWRGAYEDAQKPSAIPF